MLQVYSVSELRDMDMGCYAANCAGWLLYLSSLVMAEQHMSQYRSQRTPFVTSEILYTGIRACKDAAVCCGHAACMDTAFAATRAGAQE
jgi:hypothetical protein